MLTALAVALAFLGSTELVAALAVLLGVALLVLAVWWVVTRLIGAGVRHGMRQAERDRQRNDEAGGDR